MAWLGGAIWVGSSLFSGCAPNPDPSKNIFRITGVREDLGLVLDGGPVIYLAGVCVPYPREHELFAALRTSLERSYVGYVWPIKWADREKKTAWIVNGAHPAVARNFDAVLHGLLVATVDEEYFLRRLRDYTVPLPPDFDTMRRIAQREKRGIWDPKYRDEPWNTPDACGGDRVE
jgi:hypothetical protein